MIKNYTRREFLNPEDSSLTGCVHCYIGESDRYQGEQRIDFAISDCYQTAHLHPRRDEKISEFIKKMKVLKSVLGDFILKLEDLEDTKYK